MKGVNLQPSLIAGRFTRRRVVIPLFALAVSTLAFSARAEMEAIVLSRDGHAFQFAGSGRRFVPWGFNYAPGNILLEDVWEKDWPRITADFGEMKQLGANVVRIHLQLGKFMDAADRPNQQALGRLAKLLRLAEETGIYLDITGLGCYRTADVPKWYDPLSQADRWQVQSRFWSAVAEVGANCPAIFCYDLMNEPVVAAEQRKPGEWYSGKPFGGFDFVQFISLDAPTRPRHEIASEWIKTLTQAIHTQDKRHLITVGFLPSTKAWGHWSGFVPEKNAADVDFISVHVYPKSGELDEARTVVKQFAVGKPLVIEETFNLYCSIPELREFLLDSRGKACGWIGHYFGETPADFDALKKSGKLTIPQAMMGDWLELFQSLRPQMVEKADAGSK